MWWVALANVLVFLVAENAVGGDRVSAGFVYEGSSISAEEARALAQQHGVLTLQNVRDLPDEVAAALADGEPEGNTCLTLPSVVAMSEGAARALSRRNGILRLWGMTNRVGRRLSPAKLDT
jgi:hypothetical protein